MEQIPFHDLAAQGIGPVQNEHLYTCLRGGLNAAPERGGEGVNTRAHVLKVHDQDIDHFQHVGEGPPGFTVQAEDGNLQFPVNCVGGFLHIVLFLPSVAVLGPEKGLQSTRQAAGQGCLGMYEVLTKGGLVCKQAQLGAAK